MTSPKSSRTQPGKRAPAQPTKRPFDIEEAIPLLREAVAPYPKAALFELAGKGCTSVFEILLACVISIRTRNATVSTQPYRFVLAPALGHADVDHPDPPP